MRAILLLALPAIAAAQLDDGKRLYQGHCAPCHGVTAAGGRGPNLTQPNLKHGSTDDAVFKSIREGIAGTEMPPSWQMTDNEVRLIIAHIRKLAGTAPVQLPGDATRGAELYQTTGCPSCHILKGDGIALGPDLTLIGSGRSPEYLRRALVDPTADLPERYAVFKLTPLAGAPITGARVNEDVFSIQLRTAAGQFQSFRKSRFKSIERLERTSEMPSYNSRLTAAQIDDIVAYLATLRGNQ